MTLKIFCQFSRGDNLWIQHVPSFVILKTKWRLLLESIWETKLPRTGLTPWKCFHSAYTSLICINQGLKIPLVRGSWRLPPLGGQIKLSLVFLSIWLKLPCLYSCRTDENFKNVLSLLIYIHFICIFTL